ncbi:MAG: YkgJ family cysteine cluster protein [Gammaproteobacteria bacterium]|nr:YkgJ family cysteine cluster protein [Gammaproteobacteria bacterium]
MLHRRQPLRFECTQCGRCCTGGGDYYVFVNDAEAEQIHRHLGLSQSWFRRRYLARTASGERVLASHSDGRCTFLEDDGRCRVYDARPTQCQTYPFWPELLRGATAWEKERRRCEGIGHGPIVPVARIDAALALFKEPDAG